MEDDPEKAFAIAYPVTYERLKKSISRRANAIKLFSGDNLWRNLLDTLRRKQHDESLVPATEPWHVADEFGIGASSVIISTSAEAFQNAPMHIAKVWSILGGHTLVLFQNRKNGSLELVWVQGKEDYSRWALNHNTRLEDPEEFMEPPFLPGDPTLTTEPLVAAALEDDKRMVIAVILRQRDVLLFDHHAKTSKHKPRHWRHLLTDEIWEPRAIPVISCCFVLDSALLYASADGVLRAHPRINPRSTYHVEDIGSLVPHMVSLYNVVALVHSHHILEVRRVHRIQHDPFFAFQQLYRATSVDPRHAPLLYGPYVIYAGLDGSWYRVSYDGGDEKKELIKVPHRAGWPLLSVKNANWRYMTVVLKNPRTSKNEEYNVSF